MTTRTEPITVERYHQMIRSGILTEDDRVELLDGMLVPKMPISPRHRRATERAFAALARAVPGGWYVTMQQPITAVGSEPEPDVAVVRGTTDDYTDRHPGPDDVALVIEVADSSLDRDRTEKRAIYAAAAIPQYWIVNLVDRRVEAGADPSGPGADPDYRTRGEFGPDDAIPLLLEGREVARIAARDLLP